MAGYREIPGDTRRYELRADTGRYGEMRGDARRYGEIQSDIGKIHQDNAKKTSTILLWPKVCAGWEDHDAGVNTTN